MNAARQALQNARNELEHAGSDWGGHRIAASNTLMPRWQRFLTRPILDTNHSDSIILKLNVVVLRGNFDGVVGARLRHPCGCHTFSSFDAIGAQVSTALKVH